MYRNNRAHFCDEIIHRVYTHTYIYLPPFSVLVNPNSIIIYTMYIYIRGPYIFIRSTCSCFCEMCPYVTYAR